MTRLIDMLSLSRRIAGEAAHEPELGRAAIAWTFLNRAREAALHMHRYGFPHPVFGDGSLRDACFRHRAEAGPGAGNRFADPAFCRALAVACLTSCRDIADPTHGATHYHHHRDLPGWSRHLQPVALIGSYLFYRPVRSRPG